MTNLRVVDAVGWIGMLFVLGSAIYLYLRNATQAPADQVRAP